MIAVNHIEGTFTPCYSNRTRRYVPALAYVVSGGHTHLFEVPRAREYRLLGKTRDDAAGEAYDKVAKLLGFGYPGGPTVDQLAAHRRSARREFTLAEDEGQHTRFQLQRPQNGGPPLDAAATI